MSAPAPTRDVDFVQSLARGLAVIRAFGPDRDRLTLSDVAKATGLDKSVTRRLLVTLSRLGYVASDGRKFSLRPRVLELGYGYMSDLGLAALALPHLDQLTARLRESSSVAVLDGHQIVYVARAQARRIMTETVSVGTRLPAYATSTGRVLLAALPRQEREHYLAHASLECGRSPRPCAARTADRPARLRSASPPSASPRMPAGSAWPRCGPASCPHCWSQRRRSRPT